MPQEEEKLKLGKGVAFDKARLKRLRQKDDTWEADFRALPKPMMQSGTHCLGLVVTKRGGSVLAETNVEGTPSANDLAALLGKAMREPLTDGAIGPAASTSEATGSGRSYSHAWKNSALAFR